MPANMSLKTTILREAVDLFEKEGIDKFTEADLRKRLDISEATYTSFFKDREDLLLQSYQQRLNDNRLEQEKIIKSAANPVEEIFELIDQGSRQLKTISPLYLADLAKYPKVLKLARENSETYSYPLIYGILNRGVVEGYFRKEMNLGVVTRVILESVYLLLRTDIFPPASFSSREVFRNIYLYYLRGLCVKEHIDLLDRYFS